MLRRSSSSGVPKGAFSRDPTMSDHDVDDIAFLTGSGHDSGFLMNKRALYEPGSVLVCSQKRACLVVSLCFFAIITAAIIVAFTKPGCPVAEYTGEPLDGYGGTHVVGGGSPVPTSTTGEPLPWTNIRLPPHIRPLRYDLHLHPNITTRRVEGQVSIKLTALEETNFIIIHGRDLNVTKYSLHDKYLQPNTIRRFLNYPPHQQFMFGVSETLRRGSNYTLYIEFQAVLTEGLDGFYLSAYKTDEGKKRYLATTHFEPTSARAAFPCFDEPHLKARFQLSIVRDPDYYTLFNMPLRRSVPLQESDLVRDEFEVSVEMSTYLVCFVVCDYARVSNYSRNNVTVSVYAPSNIIQQADYALHSAITLLDYYHHFFTVPYPLPKLDLIAIPNFGAGAMENWGLVTYKETTLMFVAGEASARAQQLVTVVIAHELAHQWFGNLVTMEWWQDLWLNEGFASFMECVGTGAAQPEWSMMDQFVVETVQPALALDALHSSHPVSTQVRDPANIESLFDTISYKKGASLIYMLEMFLGRAMVVAGLRAYLDTHRFSTATTAHLWRALAKVTIKNNQPLDVQVIMDTWTRQVGHPVITVTLEDGRVTATQERFFLVHTNSTVWDFGATTTETPTTTRPTVGNKAAKKKKKKEEEEEEEEDDPNAPLNATIGFKWHVPLTYVTSEEPLQHRLVWMNLSDVEFSVDHDLAWVKFNVGQRGFYRVNYDAASWRALTHQLRTDHMRLSSADRASLIDDAFMLANGGLLNAKQALDLSEYLVAEEHYGPWHTALTHLTDWLRLLFYQPSHSHMREHLCTLLDNQYHAIGWEDTGTHLSKLLRTEVLEAVVACGNDHATETAQRKFAQWQAGNYTVPPNLRSVVYKAGVRHGGVEAWWWCWNHYQAATLASERLLLLQALAHTPDAWLLDQYLQYSLNSSLVRSQDVQTVIAEVSKNPSGRLVAWRMVRKQWPKMISIYRHTSFAIGTIIKSVTAHMTTMFDLEEVSQFFRGVDVGGGTRALAAALETIRMGVVWQEQNSGDVADWLTLRYPHVL